MTDSDTIRRRRFMSTITAAGIVTGLAGCSGDDENTGNGDSADDGDGGTSDDGDSGTSDSADADSTPTDDDSSMNAGGEQTTAMEESEQSDDGQSTDGVPVDVTLTVRSSQSNVEKFETLRATVESVEVVSADGETIELGSPDTDVDLAELGPGGSTGLFEGTIPPGSYDEARLYMPVQEAALADGGDPEFDRMVPATSEISMGDPIEVESGEGVELALTIALLRVAGDGPWTYTLGWGIR